MAGAEVIDNLRPVPVPSFRCRRCGHLARRDRMVQGYGSDCARLMGLLGTAPDVGQTGPSLLDMLDVEPEDSCDGADRPRQAG
ncbi:MAG TPA: hypothetical protein VI172_01815 [Candidatus Dormibacteraeota bacterium]